MVTLEKRSFDNTDDLIESMLSELIALEARLSALEEELNG